MAEPTKRKALYVGLDQYREEDESDWLSGCVADATAIADLLETNADGSHNYYAPRVLTSPNERDEEVTRADLRDALADLFANAEGFDLLFFFAGHGAKTKFGAELVCQDYTAPNSFGVSMNDLAMLANTSDAQSVVIVLDCCYSGNIGLSQERSPYGARELASLRNEVTLIAASRPDELSYEDDNGEHGLFTRVLLDGLGGPAAQPLGQVTVASLETFVSHHFIDPWGQRPVFKTHTTFGPVLREAELPADRQKTRETLKSLKELFDAADASISLDGGQFDSSVADRDAATTDSQIAYWRLVDLRPLGLIEIEGAAEITSGIDNGATVTLTRRGKSMWRLADEL